MCIASSKGVLPVSQWILSSSLSKEIALESVLEKVVVETFKLIPLLYDWIILENDWENDDFEIAKNGFEIEKELKMWHDDGIKISFIDSDNKVAFNIEMPIGIKTESK